MGTISGIRHSPVRSPCPLAEGDGRPHTHHSHKSSGGGKWAVCGERFRMFDATTWSMHRVHATRGRPAQATMPRNSNIAWGTSNIHASQATAAPFIPSRFFFLLASWCCLLPGGNGRGRPATSDWDDLMLREALCEAQALGPSRTERFNPPNKIACTWM